MLSSESTRLAISLIDLTSLTGKESEKDIIALCRKTICRCIQRDFCVPKELFSSYKMQKNSFHFVEKISCTIFLIVE